MTETLTVEHIESLMTPHDLKRLELYGRNLCDHHLVADLLPCISKLYFMDRYGKDFAVSSVQGALLCGLGLQYRTIDSLTAELNLPGNQVLAMFNKAVRKMSIALRAIIEEKEEEALIGADTRKKAEETAERMRDVAEKTLEEDVADAAVDAMQILEESKNAAQSSVNDEELMTYAIKGSDDQWSKVLEGKNLKGGPGTIQIQTTRIKRKKLGEDDIIQESQSDKLRNRKSCSGKKSKKLKKSNR